MVAGGTVAYFATDASPANSNVETATLTLTDDVPESGYIIDVKDVIPNVDPHAPTLYSGHFNVRNESSTDVPLDMYLVGAVSGNMDLAAALNVHVYRWEEGTPSGAFMYDGPMAAYDGLNLADWTGPIAQGEQRTYWVEIMLPNDGDQSALQGAGATLTLTPHAQTPGS
jgi:hypothetical protein